MAIFDLGFPNSWTYSSLEGEPGNMFELKKVRRDKKSMGPLKAVMLFHSQYK